MLGPHQPYNDTRHPAVRGIFAVLTAPIVLPVLVLTNAVDIILVSNKHFFKHVGLSIYHNIKSAFNLLSKAGEDGVGVIGRNVGYTDDRHGAIRGIFGALSAPIVLPVIAVTNLLDMMLTTLKHLGLSIGHNIKAGYNILSKFDENGVGVIGKNAGYSDARHPAVRGIFGVLSAPVVLPVIVVTNLMDMLLTAFKHLGLSIGHNIKAGYNILSKFDENGVGVLGVNQGVS